MDIRKLEQYAERNLSSFDDDSSFEDEDYVGASARGRYSKFEDEYYDGQDDDLVDFGGAAKSFASANADKLFTLNFLNGAGTQTVNTTDQRVYIIPGIKWYPGATGKGFIVGTTSVLNTAGGTSGYTCTSIVPMNDIDLLYSWIANNPIQCYAIRMQSGTMNKTQLAEAIVVRNQSPFRSLEEKYLYPSAYLNQDSMQNDTVMFETPGLVLSNQTQLELNLKGILSATLSITFFCGANINTAGALERKVSKAGATLARAGVRPNVRIPGGRSLR